MELLLCKKDCCGCTACAAVCPRHAIAMKEDEKGFFYPQIDPALCVDCGLCLQKCVFQNGYPARKTLEPSKAYAARYKEESEVMKSRSGGAFAALAREVLSMGGCVYGAGYDSKRGFSVVHHKCAESEKQLKELRGSKYVQSELRETYSEIRQKLEAGKTVLFSGTGCQVGGLYASLGREYPNLFTADLICHGAPSQKMWRDFLKMREKEKWKKVTAVSFREKAKKGWTKHFEELRFGDQKTVTRIYSKLFGKAYYRPSCFRCAYANMNRVGDITLGDLWGHENLIGETWNDEKGISLVMVNNEHGSELWSRARNAMDTIDITGADYSQPNLTRPTAKPRDYEAFWKDYQNKGFRYIVKKYAGYQPVTLWSRLFKKR